MKKLFTVVIVVFICVGFWGCNVGSNPTQEATKESLQAASRAMDSTPIPQISHFQERKTIAKWAQRWDKPSIPTYIYLVSYGQIIGYYVADGKPASTRSYITPEERWRGTQNTPYAEKLPDLDGTYGDNNPGIRFFTASGAAVEAGGNMGYIYSDTPLPVNVPLLGK